MMILRAGQLALLALALSYLVFSGFSLIGEDAPPYPPVGSSETEPAAAEPLVYTGLTTEERDSLFARHKSFLDTYHLEADHALMGAWVDSVLAGMTLDEKIGQLLMVRLNRRAIRDIKDIQEAVTRFHVNGFIVPRTLDPQTVVEQTNRLQQASALPLLFAADYERGAGTFNSHFTELPSNMALGAARNLDLARAAGTLTALEARAMGINLLFAPVVDVNNNPDNPIINIRSYGENPVLVSDMAGAFVDGAETHGVLTTLKHFPGHGNTSTDSHLQLGVINSTAAELDSVELKPYHTLFTSAHPPAAVMTAHLWSFVLDRDIQPATFSKPVLSTLLRERMQFKGLIITDDVEMGALSNTYTYAQRVVNPILAGADMILMPKHLGNAVGALKAAVQKGQIEPARLDASVRRVLWAKARLGLHKDRYTSVLRLSAMLDEPRGEPIAQAVADQAVTLLQTSDVLPFKAEQRITLLQITNQESSKSIQAAMQELHTRLGDRSKVTNHRIVSRPTEAALNKLAASVDSADVLVIALYLRTQVGKHLGMHKDLDALVARLQQKDMPVVLLAFGNPYVLNTYTAPEVKLVGYEQSLATVRTAAGILLGTQPAKGRLPISLHAFPYGAGLQGG